MDELFKLRWNERNAELQQEFLRVRQEMSKRGILNSSITIQNAHEVIVTAFNQDRALIVKTITDHIKLSKKIVKVEDFQARAQKELEERKALLECSLEGAFSNVINGLQNSAMIAPFRKLDQQLEAATQELSVELHTAIDEYNKTLGDNLTEQLRNQFLNNPILAVVVLSVAGAGFIIGLLRMLGIISFS